MYKIICDPGFKKQLTFYKTKDNIFNNLEKDAIDYDVFILRGRDIRQLIEKEEIREAYRKHSIIIAIDVSDKEIELLHKVLRIELDITTPKASVYQYGLVKDKLNNIHQYYHTLEGYQKEEYQKEYLFGKGVEKIEEWIKKITQPKTRSNYNEVLEIAQKKDVLVNIRNFIEENKVLTQYSNDQVIIDTGYMAREEIVITTNKT